MVLGKHFKPSPKNRSKNCPTNGLKCEPKLLLAKMDFMDGDALVNFQLKEGEETPRQQQFMHSLASLSLLGLACIARELIQRVCSILTSLLPTPSQYYLLSYYSCMQQGRRLRMIMATCYLTLCQTAICSSLSLCSELSTTQRGGAFHRQVWRNVKFIHVKLIYV